MSLVGIRRHKVVRDKKLEKEFIVNEIETALAYGWSYIGDKSTKHMEDAQYVDFYYDYTDQEKEEAVEEEEEYIRF